MFAATAGVAVKPGSTESVSYTHLLEHGIIQAGPVLCAKLNLDQGAYVYKIVRCVCQDGLPIELDYNYIPLSVCSNHTFDLSLIHICQVCIPYKALTVLKVEKGKTVSLRFSPSIITPVPAPTAFLPSAQRNYRF